MKKYFRNIIDSIKIGIKDIQNKKAFISDIKAAQNDPRSYFSQANLIADPTYTKISLLFNLPENFVINGNDRLINMKIREFTDPITNYLSYTLGWAEYIIVPQVFHIEDNDGTSGESLTYLAVWEWAPIKPKYFLLKWGIIGFLGLAALATGIVFLCI